ncbi:MAG: galactokinase [Lachnospiraceae bacterium]|nr:galactokinase [Lachnospiraceae bacterium]
MKSVNEYIKEIQSGIYDERLREIYVDEKLLFCQKQRYQNAVLKFQELFGEKEVSVYSAPGRSEVSGNHTDHQHGHVLAASINLDAVGVAAKIGEKTVRLVSGDAPMIECDLGQLEPVEEEKGSTAALIRGVAAGLVQRGYQVGGFEAYVTSDVLIGAGMSSSAAFESLVGTIFSGLYNDMQVPSVDIAKIGQYAENIYFGKPCGLMDQMACSVGGLIYIDFADVQQPMVRQIPADFEGRRYSLCIVDTKGSHADLTEDYAAVPMEMKAVSAYFGKEYLREVEEEDFFAGLAKIREEAGDRAVLRAIHFYTEQGRVSRAVKALEEDNFDSFLSEIRDSGASSEKYLQNIYSIKEPQVQSITVALAVSEYYLKGNGVCRVHGGGFAGTIQAFVKNEVVDDYKNAIEAIFGKDACHVLKIRPYGGICVM